MVGMIITRRIQCVAGLRPWHKVFVIGIRNRKRMQKRTPIAGPCRCHVARALCEDQFFLWRVDKVYHNLQARARYLVLPQYMVLFVDDDKADAPLRNASPIRRP